MPSNLAPYPRVVQPAHVANALMRRAHSLPLKAVFIVATEAARPVGQHYWQYNKKTCTFTSSAEVRSYMNSLSRVIDAPRVYVIGVLPKY